MLQFVLSVGLQVFNLVEHWKKNGLGFVIGDVWLGMLSYADDFLVLARTRLHVQQMTDQLEECLNQIGLEFSPKKGKSQYMCVGDGDGVGEDFITARGVGVQYVDTICTLKNYFNCMQDDSGEISRRVGCAHSAFDDVKQQLCCKGAEQAAKISLLSAMVAASMGWGLEGHLLNYALLRQLDAAYTGIACNFLHKRYNGQGSLEQYWIDARSAVKKKLEASASG
eukprot:11391251-Karenia_brevis.AAC.1